MKIRVYNVGGMIRIVEVTNKGTELELFDNVVDGEFVELRITDDCIDCGETVIKKINRTIA